MLDFDLDDDDVVPGDAEAVGSEAARPRLVTNKEPGGFDVILKDVREVLVDTRLVADTVALGLSETATGASSIAQEFDADYRKD